MEPWREGWRRFADQARRAQLSVVDPRSDDDLPGAVAAARQELDRALARIAAELAAAEAARPLDDDGGWRRLDEACRKLEADLRNPPTLRQRLDEGRRSMLPKVERLVHSRLSPVVRTKGRRLVATVGEDGLAELRTELPEWVSGWSEYVLSWLELDLRREIEVSWTRRDGPMPLAPPELRPLEPPRVVSEIAFPDVSLGRDVGGLAGGILRNARSIAYGLLSLTFLFGVAKSSIPWWVYLIGFAAAVAVGGVMATEERAAERRRLEAEVRHKAEQATWDATRQWLDRMADKLGEQGRSELHARRAEVVRWWAEVVRPCAEAAERTAAEAKARFEAARVQIPRLQERKRALTEAGATLDGLAGSRPRTARDA